MHPRTPFGAPAPLASIAALAAIAAVAAIAWLCGAGPAAAAVIRCVTPDGRILYQDFSCPNGAAGAPVDATANSLGRFATEREIADARRQEADDARPSRPPKPAARAKRTRVHGWNAGERRFLVTGMSEAEVRRRIGPPDSVVRRRSSATGQPIRSPASPVQWVYGPADDDPQTTTTLTFRGNMVVHIDRRVTH